MATPGELFSEEILSCLDQEDSGGTQARYEPILERCAEIRARRVGGALFREARRTTSECCSFRLPFLAPRWWLKPRSSLLPIASSRSLPNRSRRPGQRDLRKIDPAFGPMKLRDFKSPGSKNLDISVTDGVVNDDTRKFWTKSEYNTFLCIELEVPLMAPLRRRRSSVCVHCSQHDLEGYPRINSCFFAYTQ